MCCSADEAYALLAKESQVENRKVIDIATELAREHNDGAKQGTRQTATPAPNARSALVLSSAIVAWCVYVRVLHPVRELVASKRRVPAIHEGNT